MHKNIVINSLHIFTKVYLQKKVRQKSEFLNIVFICIWGWFVGLQYWRLSLVSKLCKTHNVGHAFENKKLIWPIANRTSIKDNSLTRQNLFLFVATLTCMPAKNAFCVSVYYDYDIDLEVN